MIWIFASAMLLAPAAAAAGEKPANARADGRLFCFASNRTLSQQSDGSFQLSVHMEMAGDLSRARWPGGKPLTAATKSFRPQITTGYLIPIAKDGKPAGRPKPFTITATMGRFTGGRPGPIESLRLKIEAGVASAFPEMPLDEVAYSVAVPLGKITLPESKDRDSEVLLPRGRFEPLVRMVENGERMIVLVQNGKELGRVPVPFVPLRGQSEALLAWTARSAEAMNARKACPAS